MISEPEPQYEFIKGEGWFPKSWERVQVRMGDGTLVMLIMRPPQKGELYVAIPKTNPIYASADLRRKARRTGYATLKPRHIRPKEDQDYCVVVKLDQGT